MRILVLLVYLGIGAMAHVIFAGPTFQWDSAWTWVWLFAWPLPLALGLGVAGALIALGAWWGGKL
jgi:hypothetical protein